MLPGLWPLIGMVCAWGPQVRSLRRHQAMCVPHGTSQRVFWRPRAAKGLPFGSRLKAERSR